MTTAEKPAWTWSAAAFAVAAERQVNDRAPLDGTECGEPSSLGGNVFVCANPKDHLGAEFGYGHRFVHVEPHTDGDQ